MVRLLRTADEKELFSNKELKDFLWQTMIDTETGANKLKGMLPAKTVVGHKTGSSDRNADGMKTADNDAGYPSRRPEILHCRLRHGLIRDG